MAQEESIESQLRRSVELYSQARGLAVVIANETSSETQERLRGAEIDLARMKDVFTNLKFVTIHMLNATANEIMAVVKAVAKFHPYPESYRRIAFTFSGHGDESSIHTRSGRVILEDIITPLQPMHAPHLASIPKLFFIDACRGNQHDPGVMSRGPNEQRREQRRASYGNTLVAHSTMLHCKAFEISKSGGVWMKAVGEKLSTVRKSVLDVLTAVNAQLEERYKDSQYEHAIQQPVMHVTLNEEVHLLEEAESDQGPLALTMAVDQSPPLYGPPKRSYSTDETSSSAKVTSWQEMKSHSTDEAESLHRYRNQQLSGAMSPYQSPGITSTGAPKRPTIAAVFSANSASTSGPQRVSTPQAGLQRVSTPQAGLQRVSTSQTGLQRVSTPQTGPQRVSTPQTGLQRVSTPQTGPQRVSTPQTGYPIQPQRLPHSPLQLPTTATTNPPHIPLSEGKSDPVFSRLHSDSGYKRGRYKALLNHYSQTGLIQSQSSYSDFEEYDGACKRMCYRSSLEVTLTDNAVMRGDSQVHPSKQLSREEAAKNIVEQMVARGVVTLPQMSSEDTTSSTPTRSSRLDISSRGTVSVPKIYKQRLKEHYDKIGFAGAQITYSTQETSANGAFVSEVTVKAGGEPLQAHGDVCKNKKEAEHSAACRALQKLSL